MRSEASTQFGIEIAVKDELDEFKAKNKDEIILKMHLKRRLVTNSAAIKYLLMLAKQKKRRA